MVRSLAVGFGMVTALAVAGSMTPVGQGMLGQRHSPEKVAPVSSIQDRPAAIPGPAQSMVAAPAAAPAPVRAASPVVSPAPRQPQATSAPRASQQPQGGQPVPSQNGPGGLAGVANILLNLPQILDQTHVGPSHGGPDSWSGSGPAAGDPGSARPHKRRHVQDQRPHKESGDDND